jgi:DMSO/TMAO reductase YedYZ molybdopterin-dependent catalytic subunit
LKHYSDKPGAERFSRRSLLSGSLCAAAAAFPYLAAAGFAPGWRIQQSPKDPFAGGKLLGVLDFSGESRVALETPLGDELDGRLYTDLSKLDPARPVIRSEAFYVRTRASHFLEAQKLTEVRISGRSQQNSRLLIRELQASTKAMGVHLMECAGNARSVHFGMISAGEWAGVPLAGILEAVKSQSQDDRVLISGFDEYSSASASSLPGASWIFARDELLSAGAFLATEMNGRPLTQDHGAPLRLVVPGWYGCASIKWVNEISSVPSSQPSTSQMREYASRTMQQGVPERAADFKPATIETAAMPVRIEKWAVRGKLTYRITGIAWGAASPLKTLQIRFNPDEDYVDVSELRSRDSRSWSFWTHHWTPLKPDTYLIRLRTSDSGAITHRLDAGYYMRSVEIREV